MTTDAITELALEAWRLHRAATVATPPIRVTSSSAPILYFGDLDAYRVAPIRVVTVGVNPSGEEFPQLLPWSRFPVEDVAAADGDLLAQLPRYLETLNSYFQHDPYNKWFKKSYEPVLLGMQASYYGGTQMTAIHTDVCSPVPTSPVWGGLEGHEKRELVAGGVSLWHRLVEELEPDVILASLRKEHLARITLPVGSEPEVILSVPQKTPCQVVARRVRCGEGEAILVSGAAATTPFQRITYVDRRVVGARVRGMVDG